MEHNVTNRCAQKTHKDFLVTVETCATAHGVVRTTVPNHRWRSRGFLLALSGLEQHTLAIAAMARDLLGKLTTVAVRANAPPVWKVCPGIFGGPGWRVGR